MSGAETRTGRNPHAVLPRHPEATTVVKALAMAAALLIAGPLSLATITSGPIATQSGPSPLARSKIPTDLLPVYIAASLTCPGLPWQILAGIGYIESGHGQGRVDPATGQVAPPIIGPPIDGRPGFATLPDPTSPDGWTHAVGPMQFLTTTFRTWGIVAPDRPPDATPDPNNAWDAIYSAANYLCAGRDRLDDIRTAVLRYNRSDTYYRNVLAKATEYGYGANLPTDGPVAAGSGEAVVAAAMTQLGVPYVWGGTTPGVGLDCSGLTQWAYAQIGIRIPRTTQQQVTAGTAVTVDQLRPGDLVFTRSVRAGGQVVDRGHVAIYTGGGQVIVAPKTGDIIKIRPLQPAAVQAARRILTA